MLLLIDLDNTLIDRTAAFKAWATARFGRSEVPWLVTADRDGYEPRERLALLIAQRYALKAADVLTELRAGMLDHLDLRCGGGLRTAWIAYGRVWPEELAYRPTVTAADCLTALRELARLHRR